MKSEPRQKLTVAWSFLISSSLVGFTAGLFAGMSESPVGTALVGGIFGLIGGGGIYGLITEAREKQKDRKPDEEGTRAISYLRPAASATSLLCIFCIFGTFAGIGFREGWLLPQPKKTESAKLVEIAKEAKDLPRPLQLKLVILQTELKALGVPVEQNNQFVESFIKAEQENPADALKEDHDLRSLKREALDSYLAVRNALSAISKPFDDQVDTPGALGQKSDPYARFELKPQTDIRYGDVQNAFKYLQVGIGLAENTEKHIRDQTAPDISVVLDLISRYREASMDQPTTGRASGLLRPGAFSSSDPVRRAAIKP